MFKKTSLMAACAAVLMMSNISAATANPVVDPSARVKAVAAQTTADAAKVDAAAADAKAIAAKARAEAIGTQLGADMVTKETDLRKAISAARGAAFSGDRRLEKEFKTEASRLQSEIEELKKKAKHECAAFEDKDVQLACLTTFEKNHTTDANTTTHLKDKDVEASNHRIDKEVERDGHQVDKKTEQNNKEVGEIFDHANQTLDLVRAIQLGCVPKTSTAGGTSTTEYDCPKGAKKAPAIVFDFKNVSRFGVHSFKVAPVEGANSGWSKTAIVIGTTLAGGVVGSGLGYAAFPNSEMDDHGRLVTRHWEGAIGGAALGAATGLATSLIWAALTE